MKFSLKLLVLLAITYFEYQPSDMPVEIHSDLFVAAGMIGETIQSMVTAVSRYRGTFSRQLFVRAWTRIVQAILGKELFLE